MYLVSFCNQQGSRRPFGLAAVDPATGGVSWIGLGIGRKETGATGFAFHADLFYVAVQARHPRLVAFDPSGWRRIASVPFTHVRDPHSLLSSPYGLLVASTGDNAIYRLATRDGELTGEEMLWRYPGASETRDDVHINSLVTVRNRILVSGFGWRRADGEWGRENGFIYDTAAQGPITEGLHHPHSLIFDVGRIAFAESGPGRVRIGRWTGSGIAIDEMIDVPGYPRGLAWTHDSLVIGSSMQRRVSRSTSKPLKTEVKAFSSGLYRYSPVSGALTRIFDASECGAEIYGVRGYGAAQPPAAVAPSFWETSAAQIATVTSGLRTVDGR